MTDLRRPRVAPFVALAFAASLTASLAAGCGDDAPAERAPFDQCEPGVAPDAACFAERRAPDSADMALARAIADKVLEDHDPAEQLWDWGESVLMQGLLAVHRVTGDARYLDHARAWIDAHVDAGYSIRTSDTCAPAAVAAALYGETGDARYRAVVEDALDYLFERALRTEAGAINHLGDLEALGVTVWVDSLFMFGNVLLRWHELTGDAAALAELAEQLRLFGDLLQDDPGPGFYFHARPWLLPQDEGVYWARGNAWVTASGYDYLRVLVNAGRDDAEVRGDLERQVAAVVAAQDEESGLWWSVINRPGEIYLETSASALFAYGLARAWRYGLAPDATLDVVRAARAGVIAMIGEDAAGRPVIEGISGPTTAGDFDNYAGVPLTPDISYGVGAVLLMLTEVSGLP